MTGKAAGYHFKKLKNIVISQRYLVFLQKEDTNEKYRKKRKNRKYVQKDQGSYI